MVNILFNFFFPGILPVSAVSGEGLQAALEWLAVRLGSSQVKPRNFTAAQPQAKLLQQCRTASSLSSSSSTATSKTDNSRVNCKTPAGQKPVILVNSRLFRENRGVPSASSGSTENTSAMSISTPGSSYSAALSRRTPGTVMNSFSSYSIGQSMKEDLSRRKFSAISKSDLRKMSCASLNDTTGNRKLSTASLLDCENERKMSTISLMDSPYRRKMSTSFVIDTPSYGKFSTASLVETAFNRKYSAASLSEQRVTDSVNTRKLSGASLDPRMMDSGCGRKFSVVSLGDPQNEVERPKMALLSTTPGSTPPTVKRKPDDLSLSGFGSFTPIMADYVHSDRKDSDTSADSVNMVSPSDHIQPHLRALGIKKSPFLSNSAKYVVNSIDAMKEEHYNEILKLLPEKYTSLYARDSYNVPNDTLHTTTDNQNFLSGLDDTNGNTSIQLPNEEIPKNIHGKKQFLKSPRQASQESDSSSSSSNEKHSNLDLFCTPTRRAHSDKHSRSNYKDQSSAIVPSSARGAYCSRAYSAIKCLFFRPTKDEMKQETNSISSEEDKDKITDKNENGGSVDLGDNDIKVEVLDEDDDCFEMPSTVQTT